VAQGQNKTHVVYLVNSSAKKTEGRVIMGLQTIGLQNIGLQTIGLQNVRIVKLRGDPLKSTDNDITNYIIFLLNK